MYYNLDYGEKHIKWNFSFIFISDKIEIWNVLALFVGENLGFPLFLKNVLNVTLKYFAVLVVGSAQKPLDLYKCVLGGRFGCHMWCAFNLKTIQLCCVFSIQQLSN